jgi:hypothetical protein
MLLYTDRETNHSLGLDSNDGSTRAAGWKKNICEPKEINNLMNGFSNSQDFGDVEIQEMELESDQVKE